MDGDNIENGAAERSSAVRLLRAAILATIGALALLVLAARQTNDPIMQFRPDIAMAAFFAIRQDIPVAIVSIFALSALWLALGSAPERKPRTLALSGWQTAAAVLALAGLAWFLRGYAMWNFDLSRDEQMVTFDALIFREGRLFAPFPAEWREWYQALNTTFILPIGDREGWVSSYLPVNAALHALVSLIFPPSFTGPLLVLLGGFALWRIALNLWPSSAGTRAAVMLLFLTSSQIALTGATTYAMTGHLALNLVWLWLFLMRRPVGIAGALVVGFLATGLHQPIFHPLFVLPFLDLLRRERRWRELGVYVAGYAVIGLFWLSWPIWVSTLGVQSIPADTNATGISFFERLSHIALPLTGFSIWTMAGNVLRLVVWQNLMVWPLLIVALLIPSRTTPVCRALWQGMALLLIMITVLMPAQTQGWGYRYFHGLLGSAFLVAGFGWHWLERHGAAPVRSMIALSAMAVFVLLPWHISMARELTHGYARVNEALDRIPADFVVVDEPVPLAEVLQINRPWLTNRPLRLVRSKLDSAQLSDLCKKYSVAFSKGKIFNPINKSYNIKGDVAVSIQQNTLESEASKIGCRTIPSN